MTTRPTQPHEQLAKGHITAVALKRTKHGSPYLAVQFDLSWVEDASAFLAASGHDLQLCITTHGKPIPLFTEIPE